MATSFDHWHHGDCARIHRGHLVYILDLQEGKVTETEGNSWYVPLAATNLCKPSRLEAESIDISQTLINNSPCQCFTDTARRTGDWKPDA